VRSDSLYAASIPPGTNSSAARPRRLAIWSGRWRFREPSIVARATLIWFGEPNDLHSTSRIPASSKIIRAAPPAITPVPGGVGPMTIACLLKNTLDCFKAR